MNNVVNIYGTDITVQVPSENTFIEDWGEEDISNQYWRRIPIPSYFDVVEYDKEGNALLTERQRLYAIEEVRRCKEGFFFKIKGITTYITGKYYFYLKWWKLETDQYPDFRSTDRKYFLFLNHWENTPFCLGVIRGKKRREGASSQATANLIYECIFFKNSFCGLTSKTQIDAKAAFTNMVSFGYRQLPVFLKPKQLNNKDSVTELVFAHKSVTTKGERGSAIDSDTGHRSRIDYRAPSKNAYDGMRITRILADEMGKWPIDVPASEFLSIVSKTMVQGAKRVGFCELPSTVNEMTKGGGAEFKKMWDLADVVKYNGRTPNRLVRYFTPAYEGYVGFIDKYGESVIDSPNKEQYDYLVENFVGIGDLTEEDIKLGARGYLLSKRVNLEGSGLEEEIRQNPLSEKEMFESANVGCLFNSFKLNQRKSLLQVHQKDLIEKGNFMWENGIRDSKVVWMPDAINGRWEIVKDFLEKFVKDYHYFENGENKTVNYSNATEKRGGLFIPKNDYQFGGAVDPYDHDTVEDNRRSQAASIIKQKNNLSNFDDKYNWCDVCKYIARPSTSELMYEDMIIQFFFFSCRMLPETQKPGIMNYFRNRGYAAFLMILPGYSEPGIPSTPENKQMGCEFTEYDVEMRIDKYYFIDVIDDLLELDIKKTQKYDLGMAKLWTEVACMNKLYSRKKDSAVVDITNLFRQYKIA